MPSEPVTIILSRSGWVRLAKGHDIDAATLSYRAGDEFLHSARGRSSEQAVFIDATGPRLCPASAHATFGARPGRTPEQQVQHA